MRPIYRIVFLYLTLLSNHGFSQLYENDNGLEVKIVGLYDSLELTYDKLDTTYVLYLDKKAMELEGTAAYSLEVSDTLTLILAQYLEGDWMIDSPKAQLNLGYCFPKKEPVECYDEWYLKGRSFEEKNNDTLNIDWEDFKLGNLFGATRYEVCTKGEYFVTVDGNDYLIIKQENFPNGRFTEKLILQFSGGDPSIGSYLELWKLKEFKDEPFVNGKGR